MSQWKKKWSSDNKIIKKQNEPVERENSEITFIKQKLNTIRKRENPKNIPIFENIYEPPQSSILEGMVGSDLVDKYNEAGEKIEDTVDTVNYYKDKITDGYYDARGIYYDTVHTVNYYKDKVDEVLDKVDEVADKSRIKALSKDILNTVDTLNQDPIAKLENLLSSSVDNLSSLSNLSNLGNNFKDLDLLNMNELGDTAGNINSMFKIDVIGIKGVVNKVTGSMNSLSAVFGNITRQLSERINQIKIQIQLFILRINKYIDDTLTKIANALTQNTATEKEIIIFKDQSQKLTTMMLVWYFVYNWYYIIFFLEEEDKILYEFDGNKLKDYNTYLYGAFGPAYRVVETFNWSILKFGSLKKYIPTPVIMILMFFIFFILVSGDFHGSLISNLFNAMRGKYNTSILSLLTIFIVGRYSVGWFFGSEERGDIEMATMVSKQQTIFSICFFLVLFFISMLMYVMWTVAVNIPLGIFFISTYLTLYTFFGVVFYEGFNAGMVITGITNSIDTLEPDLDGEMCSVENMRFGSYPWWKALPMRIINFFKGVVNYASLNMFEILILLMLLGGIGLYKKEWSSAIKGKVGMGNNEGGLLAPNGISNIFKQLFVWLVIINILLIIILCMFLYQKYLVMRELTQPVKEGVGEYDPTLTTRSVIASRNAATSHEEPKISMNAVERLKKMKGSEKSKAHLGYEAERTKREERLAAARAAAAEAAIRKGAPVADRQHHLQEERRRLYPDKGHDEWHSKIIRRPPKGETEEERKKAEEDAIRRYVERTNEGNRSTDEYVKRFEQNKV